MTIKYISNDKRKDNANTILSNYYDEIRDILKEKKSTSNEKLNKIYNITNKFAKDNC
jgi:DNA-directed RNA polymerase subunit F